MLIDQCSRITADTVVQEALNRAKQGLIQAGVKISDCSVQLSTTPTQFGGQRAWFICPGCNQRRGVLLKHPISKRIGCRKCLGLQYRKQRYKGMIEGAMTRPGSSQEAAWGI